ncbi:MAG TPA: type I-C CRISPR-associated protein Cas5c [Rhodocyclaceae bacterium]|nr:type I-C CRISPR-associated protein Cas5c [Rhodocyclaceae bacterium]
MPTEHRNSIEFKVWGRYALFTDPLTKVGGEKFSYQVPTYEALKGICKSIYWKPTLIWVIDEVRVMKRIRTQTKGTKPQEFSGGNTLAIYTFLADVEYQVRAHFEWNEVRQELKADQNEHKHHNIARRMLERGGRQDIFLGTRDCQGYVEPCEFGSGTSELDGTGELALGLIFHGFDYPDEIGGDSLHARFARIVLHDGLIHFERPEHCPVKKRVRPMSVKAFGLSDTVRAVDDEWAELEEQT